MKYEWIAFENKYTSNNSKESLNRPPESWLKRVLYGPLIHSHLFLYFSFFRMAVFVLWFRREETRDVAIGNFFRVVVDHRDHLKSWPRLSFLSSLKRFLFRLAGLHKPSARPFLRGSLMIYEQP